jgi:SAM-dependent methyltransferase
MGEAEHFEQSYRTGETPWDIGKPDFNLIQAVIAIPIAPCKALDIGCGTGDNAIWLSQQGFLAVGLDASEIAVKQAEEKAAKVSAKCSFFVLDILKNQVEGAPFGFAFDRGCFHVMCSSEDRRRFAQQVYGLLEEGGLWLSLIGSADEKRLGDGPPQRSAGDIASAVEPYFEILSLVCSYFETRLPAPARAWVCLMKKRKSGE